jgi:hypothetical protein
MSIGNSFALAEMSYFLFSFFKSFTIETTGTTPELMPLLTLRPDKVVLKVRKR